MKKTRIFLTVLTVAILLPLIAHGFDPYARRAQISGKLFAVTVLRGCPTEALIAEVQQKGVVLGADYTTIPEVVDASLCPATIHGAMWGWHGIEEIPRQSFTARFFGGVVVGLHYRIGD